MPALLGARAQTETNVKSEQPESKQQRKEGKGGGKGKSKDRDDGAKLTVPKDIQKDKDQSRLFALLIKSILHSLQLGRDLASCVFLTFLIASGHPMLEGGKEQNLLKLDTVLFCKLSKTYKEAVSFAAGLRHEPASSEAAGGVVCLACNFTNLNAKAEARASLLEEGFFGQSSSNCQISCQASHSVMSWCLRSE